MGGQRGQTLPLRHRGAPGQPGDDDALADAGQGVFRPEAPGRVYSAPRAAAAPQKLDTPGVSSQGMPSASSASICSLTAP